MVINKLCKQFQMLKNTVKCETTIIKKCLFYFNDFLNINTDGIKIKSELF